MGLDLETVASETGGDERTLMGAPLWPVVDADRLLVPVLELLARRPDLTHKLLALGRRDKLADEAPAVFNHLFEIAPRSADGAKDYVATIGTRSAEKIDAACRALNGGGVVASDHVECPEITPAMIEAGTNLLLWSGLVWYREPEQAVRELVSEILETTLRLAGAHLDGTDARTRNNSTPV